MMYRAAIALLLCVAPLLAQDTLTVGSGVAPAGGPVAIPVTLAEESGIGVRGIAFKVLFPGESVTSVTFARSGAAALMTPLHETALQGSGFCSYIAFFNAPLPEQIGTLTVTMDGDVPAGTTIALTFDPPSVALSNQTASVVETVANGNLSLINGSVTVSALATPANLVATAPNASQVNVDWGDVAGADHYEVWRSSQGDEFAIVGTPGTSAFTDATVSANTSYLYRVRAIDGGGDPSAFSNVDAATTIVFSTDTIIRATHITQLRTAVNAMRAAASLGALAADGTIAAGALIRASHVNALRTGLDEARVVIGSSALAYTDPALTAGVTKVKTSHVEELRNGVR